MSEGNRQRRTARLTICTFPDSKEAMRAFAEEMDLPLSSAMRMLINEAFKARGYVRAGTQIRRRA